MFSAVHQRSSAHRGLSGTHSDVCSVLTCISTISTAAGGGYALKGLFTCDAHHFHPSISQGKPCGYTRLQCGGGYPTSSPEGEPPPQDLEHSRTLNLQLIQAHALLGVLLCLVPP